MCHPLITINLDNIPTRNQHQQEHPQVIHGIYPLQNPLSQHPPS